jgi:hypothetical protein
VGDHDLGVVLFFGLLALIPANIAAKKGGSFVGWWIFGFLVWIVALPAALMKRDHRYGECPWCREDIRIDALVCPHCQHDVSPLEIA